MKQSAIVFLVCIILSACNTSGMDLTQSQFTQLYLDSLKKRFPERAFQLVDEGTIISGENENTVQVFTENAFREYKSDPGKLSETITRYLDVSLTLFSPQPPPAINKIVPVIKPREILEEIERINKTNAQAEVIYTEYNPELVILYGIDSEQNISYLTKKNLSELSIPEDSLAAIALQNMDSLLQDVSRHGENGLFMVTAGGTYELSLILDKAFWNKETFPVKGDFVIAIPTRDLLLVTGSDNAEGIKNLRENSEKMFSSGSYPISPDIFRFNGKKFEKFR